jgi:hypothetical protein
MVDDDHRHGYLAAVQLGPDLVQGGEDGGAGVGDNGRRPVSSMFALTAPALAPAAEPHDADIELEVVGAFQSSLVHHWQIDPDASPAGQLFDELRHGEVVALAPPQAALQGVPAALLPPPLPSWYLGARFPTVST